MKILDQNKLEKIKALLKTHPRGLSITELAFTTGLNRNLLAKYLDILVISGQVEIREVGPSKVYYFAQRIPVTALIEITSDFVMMLDQNLKIVHVNKPFTQFLAMPRDNLIGKSIGEVRHPFLSNILLPEPSAILDPDNNGISEIQYQGKEGSCHFRIKWSPTVFEDGSVGYTLILEDITDQRKAEHQVKESEAFQKAILKASPVGIGLVRNHTLIWANDAMYRMQGVQPGELKGQPERVVFADDIEYERASREIYEGIERQGFCEVETVLKRKDGSLIDVSLRGAPIQPGSSDIIVVASDITARKKADKDLRKTLPATLSSSPVTSTSPRERP